MSDQITILRSTWELLIKSYEKLEKLERENGMLKVALRVNAYRWGFSSEQVDEVLKNCSEGVVTCFTTVEK